MIIDADASQLEWRVGAELSRDSTMIQEIIDGVDIHTHNAISIFNDANLRQEAKVVSFRSLYGGSPYAFFMDSKMPQLPLETWVEIHERFYKKYSGLKLFQTNLYKTVCKQGWYSSFTGRRYMFKKKVKWDGSEEYSWPSTCNYIVQGTSTGDIIPLVMCELFKIFKKMSSKIKMINQVHDSIVIDAPEHFVEDVCVESLKMFRAIPKLVKDHYNYDFIVPMDGECKYGESWGIMTKFKE